MELFVNRVVELEFVNEQIVALHNAESLVRTPIIDFHGVGGIGKTTLLQKIIQDCDATSTTYLAADASEERLLFHQMIEQARKYQVQPSPVHNDQQNLVDQCVDITRSLLIRSPVVMLLDSLDPGNQELVAHIERMLGSLVEDNRLFVILASKKKIDFNNIRLITRKFTPMKLEPFSQDDCRAYLDPVIQPQESAVRDLIFELTGGYPLAVKVMVQELNDKHLDPRKPDDCKQLLEVVIEQVITQGIFANVPAPTDLEWCRSMLNLLSIPRRSVQLTIQQLIETFEPQYTQQSSLGYMNLFKKINRATDVVNWNQARAGYSVDSPVRHIFMMAMKTEHPDRYYTIHEFLALHNRRQAEEISGWDRIRYLQEYLYHSANTRDTSQLPQIIDTTIRQIAAALQESFPQFEEEFLRDKELQTALGVHASKAHSLIFTELATMYRKMATTVHDAESIEFLQEFFVYTVRDPLLGDPQVTLSEHVERVANDFPATICAQLYEKLVRDAKIIDVLGENISVFLPLIKRDLPREG